MFQRFLEQSYYYEFPSFEVAVYSLLLSFVLSSVIALTYRFTYRGTRFPNSFFQAMVLSSMVSAMVMMAVGNNLAVGFGIIGAVAIIRFRTRVRNPRNIIFIFAALSVGIATGVYGYSIAIAGTLIFCGVSALLFISPFGTIEFEEMNISFLFPMDLSTDRIEEILESNSKKWVLRSISAVEESRNKMEYRITTRPGSGNQELFDKLKTLEGVTDLRIDRRGDNEQL